MKMKREKEVESLSTDWEFSSWQCTVAAESKEDIIWVLFAQSEWTYSSLDSGQYNVEWK